MKLLEAKLELQTKRCSVLVVSLGRWLRQPFVRVDGKARGVLEAGSPAGAVSERSTSQVDLWFGAVLLVYIPGERESQKISVSNLYELLETQ